MKIQFRELTLESVFVHLFVSWLCFCSFLMIYVCIFILLYNSSPWLGLMFWPRLLCPLHLGLPVLWVPDTLQHGGGAGLVRRMHVGGLLLLLLRRRPGRRLQLPLWHGLWHHGCLLRVLRLPGNLYGVLWHLLPHIGRPVLEQTRMQGDNWILEEIMEGNCCCWHFESSN